MISLGRHHSIVQLIDSFIQNPMFPICVWLLGFFVVTDSWSYAYILRLACAAQPCLRENTVVETVFWVYAYIWRLACVQLACWESTNTLVLTSPNLWYQIFPLYNRSTHLAPGWWLLGPIHLLLAPLVLLETTLLSPLTPKAPPKPNRKKPNPNREYQLVMLKRRFQASLLERNQIQTWKMKSIPEMKCNVKTRDRR